jgi:minor extracellular serine protease Vpr
MQSRITGSKIIQSLTRIGVRGWLLLTAVLAMAIMLPQPESLVVEAQSNDPTDKFIPKIPLGREREITVVLKLAGDPVAVVRSRMPDKRVAEGQRAAIVQNLRVQQEVLAAEIQMAGGQVLGRFQHAINGIKVRGTAEQIAEFAKLPGVVEVKPVGIYRRQTFRSVPFIGAPAVWQGPPGLHGEGIKIAIFDTGIDYTHAVFGGPGTMAAFSAAFSTSTAPADPAIFGPKAPKVKGGIDLVGDNYDANSTDPAKRVPHPDPNPLDCDFHGTHVAGIAAGFGVTRAGATYTGPYNASTAGMSFEIAPGVAPLADLYAVRVFGCDGETDVIVEAIDWAVQHDMQVVNMSLGLEFGTSDNADAEASENAVNAGIVVVASAGNSGPAPYITGSPATAQKVISVAAMDAVAGVPAVSLKLNTGKAILAQNSNGDPVVNNTSLPVFVLRDKGGISIGCDEKEYNDTRIAGKLVVTQRGVCPFTTRMLFAQAHGAAGIAMINNQPGYPPFTGPLVGVTIPFLGLLPEDGPALAAATTATLTNAPLIANPSFRKLATFTSGGPRTGDGHLKPDIAAPGVKIFSAFIGSGNLPGIFDGTSFAAPHVAGVAALALQAHPAWSADRVATAIVNTADPSQLSDYSVRLAGSGLVQPAPATRTSVIVRDSGGAPNVSFGVKEFSRDFSDVQTVIVQNLGTSPVSFKVSVTNDPGSSPHSVNVTPTTVSVDPGQQMNLNVRLSVAVTKVGDAGNFRDVAGFIRLIPTSSTSNGGVALTVPYYLVPRARSELLTSLQKELVVGEPNVARVVNSSASLSGTADFYAWGLSGVDHGEASVDIRAVGVQSRDSSDGKMLVFAVNTFTPWSNAARNRYKILLDINQEGIDDFAVIAADLGALQGNVFANGRVASAVQNLSTGEIRFRFLAVAPTDSNTLLLPVLASDVGVTEANPRFTYTARSFGNIFIAGPPTQWPNQTGPEKALSFGNFFGTAFSVIEGRALFNAFNNAITTGVLVTVKPRSETSVPISTNKDEWQLTPALGLMVVSIDNFTSGQFAQTQLLPVRSSP